MAAKDLVFDFILKSDSRTMEEAVVLGKTETQQLKETGCNVNAIDVKPFANSNRDINQILNASSPKTQKGFWMPVTFTARSTRTALR